MSLLLQKRKLRLREITLEEEHNEKPIHMHGTPTIHPVERFLTMTLGGQQKQTKKMRFRDSRGQGKLEVMLTVGPKVWTTPQP